MAGFESTPQSPQAAAEELRGYAKNKNETLWPADSSRTEVVMSWTSADKGLTYLAKRAYENLGYKDAQKAKDAAILLSALFVEQLGADPKLGANTVLRVTPNGAELIRMVNGVAQNTRVEFGSQAPTEPASVDPTVTRTEAQESSRTARMTLSNGINGATDETGRPMLETFDEALKNRLIAAVPNLIVFRTGPFGNGESCNVYVNDRYYTVVKSGRGQYCVFEKAGAQGPLGTAKIAWTSNFDDVTGALA